MLPGLSWSCITGAVQFLPRIGLFKTKTQPQRSTLLSVLHLHFHCFSTPSQTRQQYLPPSPLLPACYLRCKAVSVGLRWSSPSFPTRPQMVGALGNTRLSPTPDAPELQLPHFAPQTFLLLSPSLRLSAVLLLCCLAQVWGLQNRANRAQRNKIRQGKGTT